MFENVGASIKGIAKIIFWAGSIASAIFGISLIALSKETAIFLLLGLIVIVMGILLSWLSVLLLYAYGELVERTCRIEEKINPDKKNKIQKNDDVIKVEKDVKIQKVTLDFSNLSEDSNYIDFICPNCGEKLSVVKGEKTIACPFCGRMLNIE